MSVSFEYDRYIAGRSLSLNEFIGNNNNNQSTQNNNTSVGTLVPVRGTSGVVFYDRSIDTKTSAEVNRRFFNSYGAPIIN